MKKFTKFTAIAVSLLSLLLSSCTNGLVDSTVSGDFKKNISQINIFATSDSNLVDFSNSTSRNVASRTITPGALDGTTDIVFYLGGTNLVTAETIKATNVSFVADGTSTTKGKVTIDLEPSNYKFTLIALLASDTTTLGSITTATEISTLMSSAVLVGYANADLRYTDEAANVSFYLTPDGLTGNGKIDFKFYLDNWSTSSTAAKIGGNGSNKDNAVITEGLIELRKLSDNTLITDTNVTYDFTGKDKTTAADVISYNSTGVSALDLPAGTYNVVVSFTKDGRVYSFSDDVKVLPGQTTEALIGIPDLLVGAPDAPANFKQSYGESKTADSDNYYVYFTWEDKSNTEQNFEIQLFDVTTITTITPTTTNDAAAWGDSTNTNTKTYSYDFYGLRSTTKPSWYAGSLQKNNQFAAFYIPLGTRYLARIRAVSEAGTSDWCYASNIAADGTVYTLTTADITAEDVVLGQSKAIAGKKFPGDVINLYRITYKTNGGAFTGAQPTVFYFGQTTSGNPIMCPDATYNNAAPYAADAPIELKNGTVKWTNWKINQTSGATYPNKFTACTAGGNPTAGVLYYVTDTLASADINGNTSYYKVKPVQPSGAGSLTANDYVNTGVPTNYLGYVNLVLYANYTSNTFKVEIENPEDYTFKTNYTISAQGTGTGTPPALSISPTSDASGSISIERSGNNSGAYTISLVKWQFTAAATPKATYSKITGELFQLGTAAGDISKGSFVASVSNQIEMGVTSLKSGKYKMVFKGYVGASSTPYTYTVYITLTD